jgi:energy-coupling factor transport system ATP-binding protein
VVAEKRSAIEIKNLSYTYKKASRPALENLSCLIRAGEYVAVLGANGSGKSTLLNCVNGLCVPPPGHIAVYDPRGTALDPAEEGDLEKIRRIVGTVMQNPDDQIVGTEVEEDIAFGPENMGLSGEEIRARVDRALKAAGLEALRERPPPFLSGGERQRLTLAGVLAMENEVIALDEAASMIDPSGRERLLDLLDTLAAAGKTILCVTHSLDDALRASRCLVLNHGTIVFDGNPRDLLKPGTGDRLGELEAWGFRLPESIRSIRLLSGAIPGFSVSSLDPAETARALYRLRPLPAEGLPEGPENSEVLAGGNGGGVTARGTGDAVVRFDSVFHEYLSGTGFAVPGIAGVSCAVPRNAAVILIGPSGSGKSTALKHINALLLPSRGRVRVFGEDTLDKKTKLPPLRFKAALAIQSPESALFESYTADDVAYGPRNAGLRGRALLDRVKAAMEEMGLPYGEFADRETGTLSGGEKRRAALAGVLALDSPLLLLDEPAAALDGRGRERVLALIRDRQRAGKTVVATTHSMDLAAAFDLVGVMVRGRLAAFGPPREIFGPLWDPLWGMNLPWTAALARELAEAGMISPGIVPLTAEELAGLIARGPAADRTPAVNAASTGRPETGNAAAGDAPAAAAAETEEPAGANRAKRREWAFFKNIAFRQFPAPPSPLRRLGAGKKLALLLACSAAAVAGPHPLFPLGILILALLGGYFAGRVKPKHLLRGLAPVLPYLGILVFFQVVFTWPDDAGPILFRAGFFSVTLNEILRSISLIFRLMALITLLSLFSAVTPLREFLKALNRIFAPLSRLGLPSRDLTLTISIALRFVPILIDEAERIVTAQLSRGGGKGRVRSVLAMIIPLFLRALERSEALARAMVLRLYRGG